MINLTLSLTHKETKDVTEYAAVIEPEGNGEIVLQDDLHQQKFNDLLDIIANDDYFLEVSYNGKIANATYERDYNCIIISEDSKKRLLAQSKKMKR